MNTTLEELRDIKHKLPHGSITRLSEELNLPEQTIRNYFGAHKYQEGGIADTHIQPGPEGGIVHLEDPTILNAAKAILAEQTSA